MRGQLASVDRSMLRRICSSQYPIYIVAEPSGYAIKDANSKSLRIRANPGKRIHYLPVCKFNRKHAQISYTFFLS